MKDMSNAIPFRLADNNEKIKYLFSLRKPVDYPWILAYMLLSLPCVCVCLCVTVSKSVNLNLKKPWPN